MDFTEFWQKGIDHISAKLGDSGEDGKVILEAWNPDKGFTGEKFPVVGATPNGVKCLSIYASKPINVPPEDMEELYGMWDSYLAGEATRLDLIESIPRPVYCVAVMKFLKDNIS